MYIKTLKLMTFDRDKEVRIVDRVLCKGSEKFLVQILL